MSDDDISWKDVVPDALKIECVAVITDIKTTKVCFNPGLNGHRIQSARIIANPPWEEIGG